MGGDQGWVVGLTETRPPATCPTGLLPVGGRCDSVSTTGLRWDLDEQAMEFGGLVSSSNELLRGKGGAMQVDVATSDPLLWTTVVRWPHAL